MLAQWPCRPSVLHLMSALPKTYYLSNTCSKIGEETLSQFEVQPANITQVSHITIVDANDFNRYQFAISQDNERIIRITVRRLKSLYSGAERKSF